MTKTTTATKTVIILARYDVKASGSIVCKVRNGGNKEYLVTLNANGSHTCLQASGVPCPSTKGNKTCYHVTQCAASEQLRKARKAREDSEQELERIDREVQAHIASELQAAQARGKRPESEQKRIGNVPAMNREHAPLNGNRPFSLFS